MNYDNPVARLLAILQRGKQIPGGTICVNAWNTLLETEGNQPLLMSRLGKVMELPQAAIIAIQESFPKEGAIWSHWQQQVQSAFTHQNLKSDWNSFNAHIDDHSMMYLKIQAKLLQTSSTTKLIADESLTPIREVFNEIILQVLDSNAYPEELKKYLARQLRKLIEAIDEYKISGALPLLESVETVMGHALVNKEFRSFLKDDELGLKLFESMTAAANVVTVALGIPAITQAIQLLAK